MSVIALMSDFGERDAFVGIMKGVIASIDPGAVMIDITHRVPPGDIKQGALLLWQAVSYFPDNTVFLGVVDPGVGTERRSIILECGRKLFVGPDNGLFSYVFQNSPVLQARVCSNPSFQLRGGVHSHSSSQGTTSTTFHGRDIFAPAAAYASSGQPFERFGEPLEDLVTLPLPLLRVDAPGQISGETLTSDRFGNILTSLGQIHIDVDQFCHLSPAWGELSRFTPEKWELSRAFLRLPGGQTLPFAATFQEIPPGECAALIGSTGLIEIAANQSSADRILGLAEGSEIQLIISH